MVFLTYVKKNIAIHSVKVKSENLRDLLLRAPSISAFNVLEINANNTTFALNFID